MRTLKELFIIMRDNGDKLRTGLCALSRELYYSDLISREEYSKLENYIADYRPSKRSKFYDPDETIYYWFPGEWQPRLDWINYQIKKLKS